MRSLILKTAVVVLALMSAFIAPAKTRRVDYPAYARLVPDSVKPNKNKNPNYLRILYVEADSLSTRVCIRYEFNKDEKSDELGHIFTDTQLIYADGWQHVFLPIEDVSGAELCDPATFPHFVEFTYSAGEVFDVVLSFPAIPDDVEKIDVISLELPNLRFADIDLTESHASFDDRQVERRSPKQIISSPKFNGGSIRDLHGFVNRFLVYPEFERINDIEGEVHFGLTINENNGVSVRIIKSDSENFEISALSALSNTKGMFKAARIYGVPVKTYFVFPVCYRLR